MITGKDLIEMGFKPNKTFSEAIAYANSNGLFGDSLREYMQSIQPAEIEPHKQPIPYFKNIEADCEEEIDNLSQVIEAMDELMKTPTVISGSIMPDACPTGERGQIPVGGVVAARNAIHPSMHSADICCSVMMSNFGNADPTAVLDAAQKITHFGYGGRNEFSQLPEELTLRIEENPFLNDEKSVYLSTNHLGTQGDGNHFLFVGKSEKTGDTIMVTHHGSRGFGAYLYKKGMKVAEGFRKELSPKTLPRNAWIPFDTKEGKDYWDALQVVRDWTKLNHEIIHDNVLREIGGYLVETFWNEHNFVFRDGDIFYHAKGATPLDDKFVPDSHMGLRLIPLNMSEPVLVVRGKTTETNLGFAPHGAGRNISRSAHIRKHKGRSFDDVLKEETKGIDARFYSGNPDLSELPSAYKNADSVQSQMEKFGLGTVVDRILPYGCIMAGDISKDAPWKKKKR